MNAEHEQSAGRKALVETLLAIDSRMPTSSAEGREVAKEVLRRDRRRVRILTWVTSGLFLLTVLGICFVVFLCYIKVMPGMEKFFRDISELDQQLAKQKSQPSKPDLLTTTAELTAALGYTFFFTHVVILRAIAVLFALMLAAAACTVLLIRATRGATLRQIQVSLLALSEQLETLQQSLQGCQSSSGGQATRESGG